MISFYLRIKKWPFFRSPPNLRVNIDGERTPPLRHHPCQSQDHQCGSCPHDQCLNRRKSSQVLCSRTTQWNTMDKSFPKRNFFRSWSKLSKSKRKWKRKRWVCCYHLSRRVFKLNWCSHANSSKSEFLGKKFRMTKKDARNFKDFEWFKPLKGPGKRRRLKIKQIKKRWKKRRNEKFWRKKLKIRYFNFFIS